MVMLRLLLWLPCQPGERLCYNCHVSQERINVSAVPTAPPVSFQPLRSFLAYPGFNKQCEQQDNWPHKQDQQYKDKDTSPARAPTTLHVLCTVFSSV